MQICHGRVTAKKKNALSTQTQMTQTKTSFCSMCYSSLSDVSAMSCLSSRCCMRAHIVCLANVFVEPGAFVPIEGDCPTCHKHMLWGDLVRKRNGCCDLQNETDAEELIISDVEDDI